MIKDGNKTREKTIYIEYIIESRTGINALNGGNVCVKTNKMDMTRNR